MLQINRMEKTMELTGTGASPGKVSGIAKIIKSEEDYYSFKEGNILVAEFTHPGMIVVINKAAAIVTDVGGLTCHSAIIARELGVPCVVNTKTATKAISNGQLVIVNGDKGTVQINP